MFENFKEAIDKGKSILSDIKDKVSNELPAMESEAEAAVKEKAASEVSTIEAAAAKACSETCEKFTQDDKK